MSLALPAYLPGMDGFYPIKVEVEGRVVRGEWTVKQLGRICVRAPGFGPSLTVPCGTRKPHVCAPIVLKIMVQCWLKRQSRLREEQERQPKGRWRVHWEEA